MLQGKCRVYRLDSPERRHTVDAADPVDGAEAHSRCCRHRDTKLTAASACSALNFSARTPAMDVSTSLVSVDVSGAQAAWENKTQTIKMLPVW